MLQGYLRNPVVKDKRYFRYTKFLKTIKAWFHKTAFIIREAIIFDLKLKAN
jgi:hypothetical protein